MESEAQWKEVIEFSKQIHGVAETALKKFFEDSEEIRPHLHSSELFLSTFKNILSKKNEATQAKKKSVQLALQRIKFTAEMVDGMRKEIEKDRTKCHELAEAQDKCIEEVQKEKEEVMSISKKLEEDELEENEATKASRQLTKECEEELNNVMPAIEAALKSLDLIKPADIANIKSMKNPPMVIRLVVASICVMLQLEPDLKKTDICDKYWEVAKKQLLVDVNFMRKLREYDKDNIPEPVIAVLKSDFISHPDFEPARVARASGAAESLCKWVVAMAKYDKVTKEIIKPKKEALERAKAQLGETLQSMKQNRTKLTTTEQKIVDLETKKEEIVKKKEEIEVQVQAKDKAIDRAKELIDGLTAEASKWQQLVEDYRASYGTMVGDGILAAAAINYLGVLPSQESRNEVLSQLAELISTSKEKIKCSPVNEFSVYKYCNDPLEMEKWREADFPQDPLWLDNATMMHQAAQRQLWPLCIDPLNVVNKFIRTLEPELQVAKQGDENFAELLKECAKSGKPLLLEDVHEKIDPSFDNLVTRKSGKTTAAENMKLGEEDISVHKEFRFYMTSRLRCVKPHYYYNPDEEKEREANFIVINFVPPNVDSMALEHALLSGVVAKEKRKLEAERLATNAKVSANKRKFAEISDQVLNVLSNPQGGRLISIEMTLSVLEAKKPIAEMQEQLKEDEESMKKINASLEPFRKLTNKLAKKFCDGNANEDEQLKPYDLEAFIKRAL